jgi:hypothetical protein
LKADVVPERFTIAALTEAIVQYYQGSRKE